MALTWDGVDVSKEAINDGASSLQIVKEMKRIKKEIYGEKLEDTAVSEKTSDIELIIKLLKNPETLSLLRVLTKNVWEKSNAKPKSL